MSTGLRPIGLEPVGLMAATGTAPPGDTEAPTWTGPITVGTKTASTIALTLPTASDNVGVSRYEYRVDGGAWVNNGASTAVALSGLAALTSYTIDARALDAADNSSAVLSVTTSTYRAGATGANILANTGPVGTSLAGFLFDDVEAGDEAKWFSYTIVTPPASGTLTASSDGSFTFIGPDPVFFEYQLEVDGVAVGVPQTVTVYSGGVTASVGASGSVLYAGTVAMSVDVIAMPPGTITASVAALGSVVYSGTVSMSADVLPMLPGTVAAAVSASGGVVYSGTVSMSATVLPMLPAVQASIAAVGGVVYVGTVSMYVSDGAAVWPAGRCGDSHVAVVPWVSARYAVEPGDVLSTPLRPYRVAPGGTAVLAIDYAIMYLRSAADAPGRLLSVDADAGLAAVPTPAVGADVPSGVVALAVPAPAPGDYVLRATLGTVGGRTKPAALQVQALADVPIAKVFPLDQGAVEVFEIDFAALYLPGHSDTATELAAFDASAGIAVQGEVPAGAPLPSGVVRFRVTAPSVAGDYSVTAALRTAAGRVEPARVVLRVNPLDVAP